MSQSLAHCVVCLSYVQFSSSEVNETVSGRYEYHQPSRATGIKPKTTFIADQFRAIVGVLNSVPET